MRVLLFITGFRHGKEYEYFNRFLARLKTLNEICDVFIYCNNPDISSDIVSYFRMFGQKNKHLHITSSNIGFVMGAVEAVSNGIEMGIFKDYDYAIHLHPDVFITAESKLVDLLIANLDNDYVFLVNRSLPDDERFFSFDFFVFKPRLLKTNIFKDDLHGYGDIAEHYLSDMLARNHVKFKIVNRFGNDTWFPRRIDEHLNLYHEHDLGLVEALLSSLQTPNEQATVEVARWQPPTVDLVPPQGGQKR